MIIKSELRIDHELWMNIYMNELHSSCECVVRNNCHDNLVALSSSNFQIANLITSFSFDHNFYFTISNEKCNSFLISTY
jgi:hypothetical protein